ncbi:MAG: NADH-quinone oxidoreductase subunit D [Chloroflexi bacterium]|nr:NADH-quinone oxidoreductase subunit D [Chloroflexota bacterium]
MATQELDIVEQQHLGGGRRRLTMNMGPQHPSTHGVLRVILELEGETVVGMDVVPGYLHRGVEKIGENRRYHQFMPYTDRNDYVAAPSNNLGWALAVEKLIGVTAPERAQWFRMILAELTRIASHLVWLGTHAMDIGAISMSLYTFRDREMILDVFEQWCGARLTTNAMELCGFQRDIPDGLLDNVRAFLKVFPARQQEYADLLSANPIWLGRTRGVGFLDPEVAISLGVTGPCLRGAGVNYDLRKQQPYLLYDQVDFDVPLGDADESDCFERYLVRMEEMRQSLRIIDQCLERIPRTGPMMADEPKYAMPPHGAMKYTAEAMQRHFVLTIKGFNPPVGEIYQAVESPKGELGHYIVSLGDAVPHRLRIRAPSFVNLACLPVMSLGGMVADTVALIGTIDIVLGEVDR